MTGSGFDLTNIIKKRNKNVTLINQQRVTSTWSIQNGFFTKKAEHHSIS